MNSIQKLNNDLCELFDTKKSFSLIRVGAMEGFFFQYYFNNMLLPQHFYSALKFAAGVYPVNDLYLKSEWFSINKNAIKNSDFVGFVDIPEIIKQDINFLNCFCSTNKLFFKDDISFLNPTVLAEKIENPWTKKLKNKKVLIISSHINTIKKQWKNIKCVWGDKFEDITPFELVDVIRSPFNPEVDDRQYPNCLTWTDTLEYMKKLMNNYEYDILLVGAGAYSPELANHAKQSGKIGITLCGDMQLFFGILGERWKHYSKDSNKKNWIFPLEEDIPKNRHLFDNIEKAYW